MKKSSMLILIILSILKLGLAQETDKRTLKGTILADGEPMIGVSIFFLDDLINGTVSDLEGKFEIQVDKGKTFKIRLAICICAKRPKDINIKKNEQEIVLKLNKCNFSKKVVSRITKE